MMAAARRRAGDLLRQPWVTPYLMALAVGTVTCSLAEAGGLLSWPASQAWVGVLVAAGLSDGLSRDWMWRRRVSDRRLASLPLGARWQRRRPWPIGFNIAAAVIAPVALAERGWLFTAGAVALNIPGWAALWVWRRLALGG